MNLGSNEMRILLSPGDPILIGDEIWDSDFETWERANQALSNRAVSSQDVVVRRMFDLRPLVRAVIVQIDKLRGGSPPDADWWQVMEAYVAECKRRIGLKSFEDFDRATGLTTPTVTEEVKPAAGATLASEVSDFRRRKKLRAP